MMTEAATANGAIPPSLFDELKEICVCNISFFKTDKTDTGQKLYATLLTLHNSIDPLLKITNEIAREAHRYDLDLSVPANGYRSFVKLVDCILKLTIKTSQHIMESRCSYFFRKGTYARDLDACSQGLLSLTSMMNRLKLMMSWTEDGSLFPKTHHSAMELLAADNSYINQYCFYGRCVGFQFCESLAIVLKALVTLMASFSEVYYSGRTIDSLWHGSKYILDPELRAKRVVNISQYASADFCKTFWFLGEMELMQRLPSFVNPSLVVNKVITIQPEPLTLNTHDGNAVDIPIPSAHKGPAPLSARLLSSVRRLGMQDETEGKEGMKMASSGLIFHCHGGGFVAQSSRSHETYLTQWAVGVDAPILSLDYSLAPETPYPRALEEAFYAYCWALANANILGSTAERVLLIGDSAGANINMGVTIKCIEFGIRPPDGLLLAYAPVVLSFVPSPSRMLCLMDPLLPFGFLLNCTKAYTFSPETYSTLKQHEQKLRKKVSRLVNSRSDPVLPTVPSSSLLNEDEYEEYAAENGETGAKPVLLEMPESQESSSFFSRFTSALTSKLPSLSKAATEDDSLEEEIKREAFLPCPLDMLDFEVPHDPHMSPYYASDEILAAFPPVTLLSVHMDPFLDDCIEFAKRLKSLGNKVHLDVLDGLCHGFLNFSMLSKEAHEGSILCMDWINKMLFPPEKVDES